MQLSAYLSFQGLNVLQFARKAGIAHTTVSRLLRGEVIPRRPTIKKIAAATDGQVSERELLIEAHSASAKEAA